jgi:cytochrome c oxidase cbb3-type subunit 3
MAESDLSRAEPHSGVEIDPVTNQPTTGHNWDGIRELNRPLPRWWVWTFYATIAFAFVYILLYPAIPLTRGGTPGLLGYSTRGEVEAALAGARAAQAANLQRVASLPLEEIRADPDLGRFAVAGGRSAFLVNCVQCHGSNAAGSPGYANLNDDDWLWGGTLEDIHRTISYGIRSTHPDTRISLMPAFGADGILAPAQVNAVAEFVLSLSGKAKDAKLAEEGRQVFADNCAACHGSAGEGNREFGAPRLNDAISLYGANRATVVAQVTQPRHGVMPAWAGRLNETVIKELTLYIYSLGGGEAARK